VPHPLDNSVRSSPTGPHARFAERHGNFLRYPVDVSPFLACPVSRPRLTGRTAPAWWVRASFPAGPGHAEMEVVVVNAVSEVVVPEPGPVTWPERGQDSGPK
jgi:hypothetical protein